MSWLDQMLWKDAAQLRLTLRRKPAAQTPTLHKAKLEALKLQHEKQLQEALECQARDPDLCPHVSEGHVSCQAEERRRAEAERRNFQEELAQAQQAIF